jgi:hypothetical protein
VGVASAPRQLTRLVESSARSACADALGPEGTRLHKRNHASTAQCEALSSGHRETRCGALTLPAIGAARGPRILLRSRCSPRRPPRSRERCSPGDNIQEYSSLPQASSWHHSSSRHTVPLPARATNRVSAKGRNARLTRAKSRAERKSCPGSWRLRAVPLGRRGKDR